MPAKKTPAKKTPAKKIPAKAAPKVKAATKKKPATKKAAAAEPNIMSILQGMGARTMTLEQLLAMAHGRGANQVQEGEAKLSEHEQQHEAEITPHFNSQMDRVFRPAFESLLGTERSVERMFGLLAALSATASKICGLIEAVTGMPEGLVHFENNHHGPRMTEFYIKRPEVEAFLTQFTKDFTVTTGQKGEAEHIQKHAKARNIPPV